MRKNYHYLAIVVILFCFCKTAFAGVVINEIMYDLKDTPDTDHEWVEIYNNGIESVDLSDWKFNDGANHVLNDPPKNGGQGSLTMATGDFVILAADATQFLLDHIGFSGTVIDSYFSLNNTGDTLSLINGSTTVDSVTYTSSMGANGDGKSLQLVSGSWQAKTPTPGTVNSTDNNTDNNTDDTDNTNSNTENSEGSTIVTTIKNKESAIPKISTQIVAKNVAVAGVPVLFDSSTLGYNKEVLNQGKYTWTFGDGYSQEDKIKTKFTHTYFYPGDYVVSLEYYEGYYSIEPTATDRLVIKVVPAEIAISSSSSASDYIELGSISKYETDLSGFVLKAGEKTFTIPKNTIILPGKKIVLIDDLTKFEKVDKTKIDLLYPNGNIAYSLDNTPRPILVEKPVVKNATKKVEIKAENKTEEVKESEPLVSDKAPVEVSNTGPINLGATASAAKIPANKSNFWFLLLGGVIILASAIALLLRHLPRAKMEENLADDMEILE